MTPDNFNCSNCNFSGSSLSAWGSFSYKEGDTIVPINCRVGICHDCNAITPVEKLPSEKSLQRLKGNCNINKLIEDEKKRLELLANRTSDARCLDCAGHNFSTIHNHYSNNSQYQSGRYCKTGIIHQNCGGNIYVKKSPANYFMGDRLPERFYNIEGVEIKK